MKIIKNEIHFLINEVRKPENMGLTLIASTYSLAAGFTAYMVLVLLVI